MWKFIEETVGGLSRVRRFRFVDFCAARRASFLLQSAFSVPHLYLLPLPWPCLGASFHLRCRTKSAPCVLKKQGVQSAFDRLHLFPVVCLLENLLHSVVLLSTKVIANHVARKNQLEFTRSGLLGNVILKIILNKLHSLSFSGIWEKKLLRHISRLNRYRTE